MNDRARKRPSNVRHGVQNERHGVRERAKRARVVGVRVGVGGERENFSLLYFFYKGERKKRESKEYS